MLTDRTVTDLLDAFSSADPTPGGGSASALAGALGASLLAMVAGMSKTTSGTPEARAALDAARARLLDLRKALVNLVDRDAAAYDLVLAAFKRPKDTDEHTIARRAAIQDAMRVATEVPIETMRTCAAALAEARTVSAHGNPGASSDLRVGIELLSAGLKGAHYNVELNLGSLADVQLALRLRQQMEMLSGAVSE